MWYHEVQALFLVLLNRTEGHSFLQEKITLRDGIYPLQAAERVARHAFREPAAVDDVLQYLKYLLFVRLHFFTFNNRSSQREQELGGALQMRAARHRPAWAVLRGSPNLSHRLYELSTQDLWLPEVSHFMREVILVRHHVRALLQSSLRFSMLRSYIPDICGLILREGTREGDDAPFNRLRTANKSAHRLHKENHVGRLYRWYKHNWGVMRQ